MIIRISKTASFKFWPCLVAAVVPLLLFGCQTERSVMTVEEAVKTSTSFAGDQLGKAPPRKIDDVTAILDQVGHRDVKRLESEKKIADRAPPADMADADLAKFYIRRARAAHTVGRSRQEITDYRKAIHHGEKDSSKIRLSRPYSRLSWAEGRGGNLNASRNAAEAGYRHAINEGNTGNLIYRTLDVADAYRLLGLVTEAEKYIELTASRIRNSDIYEWSDIHREELLAYFVGTKANILLTKGQYEESEVLYKKGIKDWSRYKDVVSKTAQDDIYMRTYTWLLRNYALALSRQGRLIEAENVAREALIGGMRSSGRNSDHNALNVKFLAQVLLEQGRAADARRLIDENLKIYKVINARPDSYHVADARHQRGDTFAIEGDYANALREYQAAARILGSESEFDRQIVSKINHGLALLKTDQPDKTSALLRQSLAGAVRKLGEKHYETAEIGALLTASYADQGKMAEAGKLYSRYIPILTTKAAWQFHAGNPGNVYQSRYRQIIEAYLKFLSADGGQDSFGTAGIDVPARAFEYVQGLRGQQTRRTLAKAIARGAVKDVKLTQLVRQQQNSGIFVAAMYAELSALQQQPQEQKTTAAIVEVKQNLERLEAAHDKLSQVIESSYPNFASLVRPQPVSIDQLRKVLTADEAVLTLHVASDWTYIWAFGKAGAVKFHVAKLGRAALAAKVGLLRVALEPKPKVLGDIPAFDVNSAHELYQALLAPVADGWQSAKNLIILADGPLAYLPFSLLVTKPVHLGPEQAPLFSNYRAVPWLTRSHAVSVLPSASSLRLLRELPTLPTTRPFVGFGDPLFNAEQAKSATQSKPAVPAARVRLRGAGKKQGKNLTMVMRAAPATEELTSADIGILPRLPETADELRQIALSLRADPARDVFAGMQASEARLKSMDISDVKVLAFATHGLVPGDLNGLAQPALALTPTSVSGESGVREDGLLKMDEILGLRLNADWVVLSACNTGADKSAGAEAVSGLGRAFFYAGARALLVTNWPVETNSTKLLTTTLFKLQARDTALTRGDALRQARLRLLDGPGFVDQESGREVFAYSHPIFWAAFSLIGDGGRSN